MTAFMKHVGFKGLALAFHRYYIRPMGSERSPGGQDVVRRVVVGRMALSWDLLCDKRPARFLIDRGVAELRT